MDNNILDNEVVNEEQENVSFVDVLNMPVFDAFVYLATKGAVSIKNAKQTAYETFKAIEDEEYKKLCHSVLTMDECIKWMKIQRGKFPQAGYFFIYAEENPTPRNENDLYSVALALLDANKKPIYVNGEKTSKLFSLKRTSTDIVCVVVPTQTVDAKMLNALNGTSSVIIKI